MAEPPNDPPKPPPLTPPKPQEAGGLQSFSEDLAKGFEMSPGAALRSIDAQGQVERSVGAPQEGEGGISSVVTLLELPEEEGKLELARSPSVPSPRTPASVRGPGFAANRPTASGRRMLILGTGTILIALAGLLWFIASHRDRNPLTEAVMGVPLSVDSVPAGAAILVDGHETGQKTPATLASWDWLLPHEIELKLPGRATFQQMIPEGPHPPPLRAVLAPVAFLDLQTTPAGAEVRRGEYTIGTTPGHFELMGGEKNVLTLVLPGHMSATVDVSAAPGEVVTRTMVLAPAGTLNLDSDPSGVKAEVDGHPAGETPLQIQLEAGRSHLLRLSASGLNPEERKVVVPSGGMTSLNVLLGDRLDRELRARIAGNERRLRAARAEMQRLDNPRLTREYFQTMARTRRRTKLESEVDSLETQSEELRGSLDSHRSVLEDLVEKKAQPSAQRIPSP
jgi:hypothetical protein